MRNKLRSKIYKGNEKKRQTVFHVGLHRLQRLVMIFVCEVRRLRGASISEPRGVTCQPTQLNAPRFNPRRKLVLDLPTSEGWKAELT